MADGTVVRVADLLRAKTLLDDSHSCVTKVISKMKIKLPPCYIGNIRNGMREVLNDVLKRYSERLDGVVMAFEKVSIHNQSVHCMIDVPVLMFDIEVDFFVFRPTIGSTLKGVVNKISKDHIGCLVHECFNVSLSKHDLKPSDVIRLGSQVLFEVIFADLQSRIIFLRGKFKSLLNTPTGSETNAVAEMDDGYSSELQNGISYPDGKKLLMNHDVKTLKQKRHFKKSTNHDKCEDNEKSNKAISVTDTDEIPIKSKRWLMESNICNDSENLSDETQGRESETNQCEENNFLKESSKKFKQDKLNDMLWDDVEKSVPVKKKKSTKDKKVKSKKDKKMKSKKDKKMKSAKDKKKKSTKHKKKKSIKDKKKISFKKKKRGSTSEL